jgi:cytochrome c
MQNKPDGTISRHIDQKPTHTEHKEKRKSAAIILTYQIIHTLKEHAMKFRPLLILSAMLLAGNALADEALLRKSGCLACHTVEKKLVGPALKDIAAKYAGQPGIVDKLAKKVRAGGSGNWGTVAMAPAPATVSDADLKAAITYVLTLK